MSSLSLEGWRVQLSHATSLREASCRAGCDKYLNVGGRWSMFSFSQSDDEGFRKAEEEMQQHGIMLENLEMLKTSLADTFCISCRSQVAHRSKCASSKLQCPTLIRQGTERTP